MSPVFALIKYFKDRGLRAAFAWQTLFHARCRAAAVSAWEMDFIDRIKREYKGCTLVFLFCYFRRNFTALIAACAPSETAFAIWSRPPVQSPAANSPGTAVEPSAFALICVPSSGAPSFVRNPCCLRCRARRTRRRAAASHRPRKPRARPSRRPRRRRPVGYRPQGRPEGSQVRSGRSSGA